MLRGASRPAAGGTSRRLLRVRRESVAHAHVRAVRRGRLRNERHAHRALHLGPPVGVAGRAEGERLRGAAAVARAPDAVHVLLGEERDVVVDHAARGRHVQPAGGDVGRHHDVRLAGGERVERLLPLPLAAVAVDEHGAHLVAAQRGGHPAGAPARAAEHHHAAAFPVLHERDGHRGLRVVGNVEQVLPEVAPLVRRAGDLGALAAHEVHAVRVAQHLLHHGLDGAGQGGGEEEHLPRFRRARQDLLRLRQEAHVEHAVRLVQHELLDERERQRVELAQLAHAARRAHQEVDALGDHLALRRQRALAEHRARAQHAAAEQLGGLARHLLRELARGAQHDRAQAAARVDRPALLPRGRLVEEPLRHRQEVGERLARARRRDGRHVAALDRGRDRGLLDRGRRARAHALERRHQEGRHAERGEAGAGGWGTGSVGVGGHPGHSTRPGGMLTAPGPSGGRRPRAARRRRRPRARPAGASPRTWRACACGGR